MAGFFIAYSNSYEVLRAQLLDALATRMLAQKDDAIFAPLEVVSPCKEIDNDLRRAITQDVDSHGVCIGLKFERLDAWLSPYGNLWRESSQGMATLPWKIFSILKDVELGRFANRPEFGPLAAYLNASRQTARGNDAGVYALSVKIASVFKKYVNYRIDWVLEWLGVQKIGATSIAALRPHERELLKKEGSFSRWQIALWQEIQAREAMCFGELSQAGLTGQLCQLVKGTSKISSQASTPLFVFLPRSLPPLSLPLLASEAMHRDVMLFILNPCREYWFDPTENSVPLALFADWRKLPGENALLHTNAMATRAFIDRLWQFMPDDELRDAYLPIEERQRTALAPKTVWGSALYNAKANSFTLPEIGNAQQSFYWVERKVKQGSTSLTLLDALANSVLRDGTLRSESDPDTRFIPEAFSPMQDVSLRIAGASTLSREIEGLVDWIYAIRERDHTLEGEDILVVTPDIDAAEPLIRGILNALPASRRIDYQIISASGTKENEPVMFGRFLYSRASYADFMELLGLPLFADTWQLSYEDIRLIAHWLSCAGYRAGLNDAHLAAMIECGEVRVGSEDEARYQGVFDGTLERAMERLSFGFMSDSGVVFGDTRAIVGSEDRLFQSDSVCANPDVFKKLLHIYALLTTTVDEDGQQHERTWEAARTVSAWTHWCMDLTDDVFSLARSKAADQARSAFSLACQQTLRSIAEGFAREEESVTFDALWSALMHSVRDVTRSNQREGAVTFAGMRDLRHLPFKAIAMIGMNESANFPGGNTSEEFDLTMALRDEAGEVCRRRGDRDARSDNRNLFLDYLLAARSYLLISYESGFEPESSPKSPSIVVQEFLQWLRSEGLDTRSICYTLPLTRYSQKQFLPLHSSEAMFFNGTDAVLCSALQTRALEAPPAFVPKSCSPMFQTDDAGKSEKAFLDKPVPFKDFVGAWLDPEGFILKKLGLRDEQGSIDAKPTEFLFPTDTLLRHKLKESLFEQQDPEAYIKELCLDPRYGFSRLRREFLEEFLQDRHAFKNAKEILLENRMTKELKGLEYRIHLDQGQSFIVKLPTLLWAEPKPGEQEGYIFFEALSKSEKTRCGVLRLMLRAMSFKKTVLVAERSKDAEKYGLAKIGEITFSLFRKKRGTDEYSETRYAEGLDPHQLTEAEATKVIEALGAFYVTLMKRLALVATNPREPTLLTKNRPDLCSTDFSKLSQIQDSWIFGTKEQAGLKPRSRGKDTQGHVIPESHWVVEKIEEILRGEKVP